MRYKAIKFFGIAALLLLPLLAGAQQPQAEEEELKQLRQVIDQTVANYETQLGLEDWQSFYVDSILTHDYEALRIELKSLRDAKVSNADIYQVTQDKWAEQVYVSLQKVFTEEQWNKYLKSGAARDKKARDKRAAKRK
ncbi:hypothetical protein SAMN06298214_1685 [Bacteroidales bacterium WCE2004]|jgi:type II secretory pathway pseudopilin PulG|nr:hypothetical protein [Bacteroidales bacterium]SKC60552.1 hypothetical protein SAMN06298214_1685 [Bacteroidales bacterium WCE2004]